MNTDQKVIDRLVELIQLGEHLRLRLRDRESLNRLRARWIVSSQAALRQTFGENSEYFTSFRDSRAFDDDSPIIPRLGILEAAKHDYESGFLFNVRNLIAADVFSNLLDQATHLLHNGYYIPAAVLAGCVLEDGLRKLCVTHNVTLPSEPKLNFMNDQLKDTAYNALTHKNIAVWANLRNDAAHGNWNSTPQQEATDLRRQVANMITGIESFLSRSLS